MSDSRSGRDCKHGHLARACEICDLEAKLAALEEELAELRRGEFICRKCLLRKDGEPIECNF